MRRILPLPQKVGHIKFMSVHFHEVYLLKIVSVFRRYKMSFKLFLFIIDLGFSLLFIIYKVFMGFTWLGQSEAEED